MSLLRLGRLCLGMSPSSRFGTHCGPSFSARRAGTRPSNSSLRRERTHYWGCPNAPSGVAPPESVPPTQLSALVCDRRYRASGLSLTDFLSIPLEGKPNRGERLCIVANCERPAHVNSGICSSHHTARRTRSPDLSVHDWIARTNPSGFRSWGPCVVASCIRDAAHGSTGLCYPHGERWAAHRRRSGAANTKAAILEWARSAPPIPVDYAVIFKGLPEQMILQILVGIQYRSDNGTRTFLTVVPRCRRSCPRSRCTEHFRTGYRTEGTKEPRPAGHDRLDQDRSAPVTGDS